MTQPTEPIEFSVAAQEITERFSAAPSLSGEVLAELKSICTTSNDAQSIAEHGRDWWPLAMHWALQGKTPRKAGAVCTPSTTEQVAKVVAV